ncbi:MAG: hypothetical protein AMJ78_01035 [Omnitrophica WOR_2 bacterium SM23_29]|nr:MAG: hypothetical protein AMJ78_01035 [Omnitrophica WOR_2 bacterium SM23_29]
MLKSKFKKHLCELKRIRVGAYRNTSTGLFLDRNERTVPFGAKTLRLLHKRLANARFNFYPDVSPFYKKLADWLKVEEGKIYITEGVSGAIKALIESIAEPGDNIVFPMPGFALYPVYCQMFNLEYKMVGYTKEYKLDVDKMLRLLDERTSILFLPNPNVPIEGTLDLDAIESIAEACLKNKTFLAIDEVYFGFGGPTAIGLIDRFENTFVMRSFSKGFGLPSIRLGYLLGSPENIDYVSKVRAGYETNTASMEVACFFLDNYHIVESYIKDVREGLAYLKGELDRLGLEHNGGNASNFVYVNLRDRTKAERITQDLEAKNIYVRSGWPEPYSGGFSVTGAPKSIMKQFVNEISAILRKIK